MDCDIDCLIDFSNFNISISNEQQNIQKKSDKLKEEYNKLKQEYNKFNKLTKETYRVMREMHIDPITHEKVPDELAFKFEYMWDPITGDRTEKDIYGSLYFNVLNLAKNFYYNRLRMLWIEGEIYNGIQYQGYYGDGVEAGEDLYVPSRGDSKHMHLFRLPIIDCYLPEKFSMSIITMGPKLTKLEIEEIQEKINNYYKKNIKQKKNLINLVTIYNLYNKAINKSTDKDNAKHNAIEAKFAVECLKKI